MLLSRNETRVVSPSTVPLSLNGIRPHTLVSETLSDACNSSGVLRINSANLPPAMALNADLPPPVLACATFTSCPDFNSQTHLEREWSAIKEQLRNTALSEQDVLEVLRSGILYTQTGKALSGLFAEAMLRSIRPVGTVTESRLKEIVDVICHLPPDRWQSALGENVRFPSGQSGEGVTGFIQSQLIRSSEQRDERIANSELVQDAQWEAIKWVAVKGRSYIRPNDSKLYQKLIMLEDMQDVRPKSEEAHKALSEFIHELQNPPVGIRQRWHAEFPKSVETVLAQISTPEISRQTWLEWISAPFLEHVPNGLITLRDMWRYAENTPSAERGATLLSRLETIERNADFFSNVSLDGPRIPEGIAAKLLYAFNAMDTFGVLKWDHRHISTSRPDPVPDSRAWKNGASALFAQPFAAVPEPPQEDLPSLSQFAAKFDDIVRQLVGKMMPWDSAYADEVLELEALMESASVYQSTTGPLEDDPSVSLRNYLHDMGSFKEQLQSWLGRMSDTLIRTGVAVMGRAGDLIERNPGRSLAVFSLYTALTNLYTEWFLPEVEEEVDPLKEVVPEQDPAPDEAFVVFENTLDGIDEMFEDFPVFAQTVEKRISESEYLDPSDDPQLVRDIEMLLQQPAPGQQGATYQDYLQDVVGLAALDAQTEFEYSPSDESASSTETTQAGMASFDAAPNHVRSKRSVGAGDAIFSSVKNNPHKVSARTDVMGSFSVAPSTSTSTSTSTSALAHWLVEAGQRSSSLADLAQPDENQPADAEVKAVAGKFMQTLEDLQLISDPLMFIHTVVNEAISKSNLPQKIKSDLSARTMFDVQFRLRRTDREDHKPLYQTRHKKFSLAQLLAGQHKKEKAWREEIAISWPSGYSAEFKSVVDKSDLEADYKTKLEEVLAQPGTFELWEVDKKLEIQRAIKIYLKQQGSTESGKKIAKEFLADNVKPVTISIRDGSMSKSHEVSNAIYLPGKKGSPGLFVFLGGNSTVIEYPVDLLRRSATIEKFPALREELSRRISLRDLLARGDKDFKFSLGYIDHESLRFELRDLLGLLGFPLEKFTRLDFKVPYEPIMFGWEDSDSEPIYKELFQRQIEQVTIAIDTLSSTPSERLTDAILQLVSDALAVLATCTAFLPGPGALTAGLSMLFGFGSAGTDFARGELEDDQELAAQHKANTLRGVITELIGAYVGKAVGRMLSKSEKARIRNDVFNRLDSSGRLSDDVAKYLPLKKLQSNAVSQIRKLSKWIAPAAKDSAEINLVVNKKFINHRTANKMRNLARGPEVAQKLMDKTGFTYYAGPTKGYLYKGIVMRGDMRHPYEVFSEGFQLRTPVTDVRQVNGMRGGFGGGKDALDPDGNGISTSAFYKKSGAGAFHYGGAKGGYDYVINGKDLEGFHLYRNHNLAAHPRSRLGFDPLEINYGANIPPSKILGAYDANGVFYPNPNAFADNIASSTPTDIRMKNQIPKVPNRVSKTNTTAIKPG